MIDLRKGVKTTATVVVYSSHSEMIIPYIVGDRVRFRRHIGYCECNDAGINRNYVFDHYTTEDGYTMREAFEKLNDTISVKELVFDGIDELPISGDAEFRVGKGTWKLTW